MKTTFRAVAFYAGLAMFGTAVVQAAEPAVPGSPIVPVSAGVDFDQACMGYYKEGNDPEVDPDNARSFCSCLVGEYGRAGLRGDAFDFLARTYIDDVTTFLQEYTSGDAWMAQSARAEDACKSVTGGGGKTGAASKRGPETAAGPAVQEGYPRPAGSWGGIVRSGPGRRYDRVGSLAEGERISLLEKTDVVDDGYAWFRIRYRGDHEGYKWGGILCSVEGPVADLYETCK